ncbi:MAG: cell surface protein [Deinococcota bacterium]|nr:cell surface protein [Deinococcota bacterium]
MTMSRMNRSFLSLVLALLVTGAAAQAGPEEPSVQDYEVWALDQGTNRIHILGSDFAEREVIDLEGVADLPHMIDFSSDFAYAFIANVASGNTLAIRTEDREVVATLETGPGTHMASVSRDDRIIVDVLGNAEGAGASLVEIVFDRDAESFTIGRSLVITEDPLFADLAGAGHLGRPVCHDYSADGRYAYVTLGPALTDGVLVVLDVDSFTLAHVFDPEEIRANCGTMLSPDGRVMFVNGGSLEEGHWYAFDPETFELLHQDSSRGNDAHGVWFTPDGSELWMVNRASSNAIIIDPESFAIIAEIDFVGSSPDILTIAPDSSYAFVTLRGPNQRSGPHAIAGDTPGVAVIDVSSRELVQLIEPAPDDERSDFHGIGLRPIGSAD